MGVTVDTPKTETATKKTIVATTIIHVGEKENFKVFQKGEEVKGISKADMEYLTSNGFVKEL